MSPEFKAVLSCYLGRWIFWLGVAYICLGTAGLMSGMYQKFIFVFLCGSMGSALIAWTWGDCAASPTLFLAPRHRKLHRLIICGVLLPAGALLMLIGAILTGIHPGSALAVVMGTTAVGAYLGCSYQLGSLRMMLSAIVFILWIGIHEHGAWHPSDGVVILLAALLYWSMWLRAIGPWQPPLSASERRWNFEWDSDYRRFRDLPRGSGILAVTWRQVLAWTQPSFVLTLFVVGLIVGCGYFAADRWGISNPSRQFSFVVFTYCTFASLMANVMLLGATGLSAGLISGALALDRLRMSHRSQAATVLMLTLITRSFVTGVAIMSGLLFGGMGWTFVIHGHVELSLPWFIWPACALVWCLSAVVIAFMPTLIRGSSRWILPGLLGMAVLVGVEVLESHLALIAAAVCVAILTPIAWYRLTNVELP